MPPAARDNCDDEAAHGYLHSKDLATITVFDADELRALGPVPPRRAHVDSHQVIEAARDLMAGLQRQLRAGADALQKVGAWRPFALTQPGPQWSLERRADGTVRRSYLGAWTTITLASAADLFVRWWPQLRRCEHEPCEAWFLPTHRRQRYHDARCAAKARYQRFKPTRDYKTEYSRRYDSTRTFARRQRSRKVMTVTRAKGTGSDRQVQARASDQSTIFDPRLN